MCTTGVTHTLALAAVHARGAGAGGDHAEAISLATRALARAQAHTTAPRPVGAHAAMARRRTQAAQLSKLGATLARRACNDMVNTALSHAYAEGSKGKAERSISLYLQWCDMVNMYPHEAPGGITDYELSLYAAWLSQWLQADTVGKYICMGVRLVHEAGGIRWRPPRERLMVALTIKGVRRMQGDNPPKRKLPMTIQLLASIRHTLQPSSLNSLSLWAACLTLFYCCLRKAHVTVKGAPTNQTMLLSDLTIRGAARRIVVAIRHTKTRQFNSGLGSDTLQYLIPEVELSALCPTAALTAYLMAAERHLAPDKPLFNEFTAQPDGSVRVQPLRYSIFLSSLKALIARAGLDPALYAGQSFRRGGATFALNAGVPETVIRAMGDWKSDVWRDYVSATAQLRERASFSLARAVTLAERETDDPILY